MNQRDCPSTPTSSGPTPTRSRPTTSIIVGGGGHGLATAYYLAKNHGITNVAVLEKGWLAGGNMARNTTIIRSNYLWDESAAIYETALKLWETWPRSWTTTSSSASAACSTWRTPCRTCVTPCAGSTPTTSTGSTPSGSGPQQVKDLCPIINISEDIRYPVLGAHLPAARRHRQARLRRLGVRPGAPTSWAST